MTLEKIAPVKSSWQQMPPIQDTAAQLFYERLFKDSMVEQGRKLMAMITMVVTSLDRPSPMLGTIEDLGRRHVAYGVTEAHYDTVGSALLWTLGKGLGERFTEPVEAAWTAAYTILSSVMKQAACAPA